jgi:hypothetical protein
VGSLDAQVRRKNPTSKLYVADVKGTSQIDTGETIAELTKRSVYTAQGTIIETKDNSTNALVLSNGTGMYFDPATRMEVKKFVQEPFTPNRNDMEMEPSISSTVTFLSRGLVGICTSKLAAGSTMNFNTPHASIRIKGRKAVIEVGNEGTKVSLIEGDITVRGGNLDAGGQTLAQGQQALIKPDGTIEIRDIPANELISIADKASMACMARTTVYFDIKEKTGEENPTAFDEAAGAGDEIVAIEVTPTDISPEVTVSAASIPRSN